MNKYEFILDKSFIKTNNVVIVVENQEQFDIVCNEFDLNYFKKFENMIDSRSKRIGLRLNTTSWAREDFYFENIRKNSYKIYNFSEVFVIKYGTIRKPIKEILEDKNEDIGNIDMNSNELKAIAILKHYMQISDVDTSRNISDALKELEDLVEKDKQKNCRECYILTGKALEMLQESINSLKEELSFYKNNNQQLNDDKFDNIKVEKKLFETRYESAEPEMVLTQSKQLKEKRTSVKSRRFKNFKPNTILPNKMLLVTYESEPKEVYVKHIDTRPPKKGEYYSPQGLYFDRAYQCKSDMMFGTHYILEISDKPFN